MKKRIISVILLFLLVLQFSVSAFADEGTGKAYTYNHKKQAVALPDPYTVVRTIYGENNGFSAPVDMAYHGEYLYILCGDGTVSQLDKNFEFVKSITLTKQGERYETVLPKALWVDSDESFLIADHDKRMVIRTTPEGEVIAEYARPESGLAKDSEFMPYKVITDYLGRIYVLSDGEYRGIIQLEPDGKFMSYFGSKSVEVTPMLLLDMAWRKLMSKEQISNTARYLPTEYSNMTIDRNGFLYVTSGSSSDESEYIVKLNSNGSNILDGEEYGDYNLGHFGNTWYNTSLNAIAVDEEGFITVADKTWNRIMQYSSEGDLLYIFAGQGEQAGTFKENSQLIAMGSNILVLDASSNSITVFEPTEFGKNVREGYLLFEKGLFTESIEPWERVLESAGNYEAAYVGIGKALQLSKDYKGAMEYFKMGYSKTDYSKAYQRYRSDLMRNAFPVIMAVLIVTVVSIIVLIKYRRKKYAGIEKIALDKRGKGAYLFYSLIHPFDGFSEMRYNRKESMMIANVLAFAWFVLEALKFNYCGFLFNSNEPEEFSVISLLLSTVGFGGLFCLSNWLLSTFFEGKGKLRNVWIAFCYALVPMLLASVLDLGLSNILTLDEGFFITYLNAFGVGLTVFLAFVGIGEIHQYSFKKNIFSLLASIGGVLIILFILFLMFNLYVQVEDFVSSIVEEFVYRTNAGF